jgi:hypothetical protein
MAKQNFNQNQSSITITLEAEFKHHTSIGPNGEALYDAPMEIKDQADLDAYGITWGDCLNRMELSGRYSGITRTTVWYHPDIPMRLSGFDSCIIRTALRYYPDPDLVLPGNSSGIIRTR